MNARETLPYEPMFTLRLHVVYKYKCLGADFLTYVWQWYYMRVYSWQEIIARLWSKTIDNKT